MKFNGYEFGLSCTKATYKRISVNSRTYQALCFIKYNPNCKRKSVQQFVYGEPKYTSYSCFVFKNLLADNLIEKVGNGRNVAYHITPIGEGYIDYFNRNHYKNK